MPNRSPLDIYLQNRINENASKLSKTIDDTLQREQQCLELIVQSINHCKMNIAKCDKIIKSCRVQSLPIYQAKRNAFHDNLVIWNTLGHIQMASIEMKGFIKQFSSGALGIGEQQNIIKSAYVSIYETSKRLIDGTGDIMKFLSSNFVSYDSSSLKLVRKELTTFRENNKDKLILVRNKIAAHRDSDVCEQIETIEGLHLSEAVSLITEYGRIINKLGVVTSPLKALGIKRLEATKLISQREKETHNEVIVVFDERMGDKLKFNTPSLQNRSTILYIEVRG